jgi:hypothetical protein
VEQAVWLQLNGRRGHFLMQIASEGKHLGLSKGWTYQLKDLEGESFKDSKWVSERNLKSA